MTLVHRTWAEEASDAVAQALAENDVYAKVLGARIVAPQRAQLERARAALAMVNR